MSHAVTNLSAEMRDAFGTGPTRELRRNGMVPGIIYGPDKKNIAVSLSRNELMKICRKSVFFSTVIQLNIGEKNHKVLPQAVDFHPVTDLVTHVDFVYIEAKTQKVRVPILFQGQDRSISMKRGGVMNIVRRSLLVSCPSDNIPAQLVVDISAVRVGQSVKARTVPLPEGCTLLSKPEFVVVSITGRGGKSTDTDDAETPAAAPKK